MLKHLAACALFAWASTAAAEDYSIVVHGLSYHTQARLQGTPWNERNVGLALRIKQSNDLSYQLGVYRDSLYRTSAYGLVDYTPLQLGDLQVGGFAGIRNYGRFLPIVGATVRYEQPGWAVTLRIAPAPQGVKFGVVYAVEFSKEF